MTVSHQAAIQELRDMHNITMATLHEEHARTMRGMNVGFCLIIKHNMMQALLGVTPALFFYHPCKSARRLKESSRATEDPSRGGL